MMFAGFFQWIVSFYFSFCGNGFTETGEPTIPRSQFLATTAVVAGAGLMGTFAYRNSYPAPMITVSGE
jgi:hypothetical protein